MGEKKTMKVCRTCGSEGIQELAWVEANTGKFVEYTDGMSHSVYCAVCDDTDDGYEVKEENDNE